MKRVLFCLFGFIQLCTSTKLLAQQEPDCRGPVEVCNFFKHFVSVFNERDWKQFSECLAEDVTGMFDASWAPERKEGRKSVESMFGPMFPAAGAAPDKDRFLIKPEDLLIQDLGDAAVISFHMRNPGNFARRCLVVRKKDNKWQIVYINGSSFSVVPK
jgi:SnoaL-like domain